MFKNADEVGRLADGVDRAGVQPDIATAHLLHAERAAPQIFGVDVGDLQLAPRRGLYGRGNVQDFVVVKIEAGDSPAGFRLAGLFFDGQGASLAVEVHHAEALRIGHGVGEDRRPLFQLGGAAQLRGQIVAIEDVVAQDQGTGVRADEIAADDEGLGQALRARLDRVGQLDAPLPAVAQQGLESLAVLWSRDDEDLPYPRQHEGRQRIVDHRLVVDRQELLADGQGYRVEPGARAAGQDDALHVRVSRIALSPSIGHSSSSTSGKASRQGRSRRPKHCSSLVQSRRELAGRCAGVG